MYLLMKVFLVGEGERGRRSSSEGRALVLVGVARSLVGEKEPRTPEPTGDDGELRPITMSYKHSVAQIKISQIARDKINVK